MVERMTTLCGIFFGLGLILFGITWPDNRSNYYVVRVTRAYEEIEALERGRGTAFEIDAARERLRAYQNSWGAGLARFLDLKSILIVLGGSFSAVLVAFQARYAFRVFVYPLLVFRRDRFRNSNWMLYESFVRFADLRYRGEPIPDAEIAALPMYFARDALNNFIQIDWLETETINDMLELRTRSHAQQQGQETGSIRYMGEVAPAFGMVGTVVGLILLLSRAAAEDSTLTQIIGGMSVALITTLYGLLLSQLLILPLAAKLERQRIDQLVLYHMVRQGVLLLHQRERAEVMEQYLLSYLSSKQRQRVLQGKQAELAGEWQG